MYRNDWDAAVARATALEEQLRQAQAGQAQDAEVIALLQQQLAATQAELARLRGAGPYAAYPPPFAMLPQARGGAILTLGILSLVVCGLLGPIAWAMSTNDLAAIDRGELDPRGRGTVTAGRVCGIIGTVLMIVQLIAVLAMFGTISSL